MQVLQDEDDGAVGGEALQQPDGQFEEAGRAVLTEGAADRGAQLGEDPGQFALLALGRRGDLLGQQPPQAAQGGGEGREGQSVAADLHTAADRDDRVVTARAGDQLLDEPGLADPRLTADEQRLRLADGGAGERIGEYGQLAVATDEHRTD